MRIGILFWGTLAVHLVATGAPSTGTSLSSSEHPVPSGTVPHPASYG